MISRVFGLWCACMMPCLSLAADDSFAQRDLCNVLRAELALATHDVRGTNIVHRLPVPALTSSIVVDGALDDEAWSQATMAPVPYARPEGDGRVVDDAQLLAFRGSDRLFLGLRFPSQRKAGTILTLYPSEHADQDSCTFVLLDDGQIALATQSTTVSLRAAASRHGDTQTTIEMELAVPAEALSVCLPDGGCDDRPLIATDVRLVPADVAWRWECVERDGRHGSYQLRVTGPSSASGSVTGEVYHGRATSPTRGWESLSPVADSRDGARVFHFEAPAAIGLTLLRVEAAATATWELKEGWRRYDTAQRSPDPAFAAVDFDDSAWRPVRIPERDDPDYPVDRPWVHYRVTFTPPETWHGKPRSLFLQKIDDHGWVYLNGQFIGEHHRYDVPFRADVSHAIRPGRNVLAVLVKNDGHTPGGLVGRVAIEEPGSGPLCATIASFIPDTPRLLEQVEAVATDPEIHVHDSHRTQLAEIKAQVTALASRLGTRSGRTAWDDVYRDLRRLGRRLALDSPLLDFQRLVFVKRKNFGGWDGFFGYTSYLKPPPATLCVLESARRGGPVRTLLHTNQGCVRDPDVAFDGRRIVFAYAEDQDDTNHLYEINSDGTGLRQLTTSSPFSETHPPSRGPGVHDVEPCYLPNGDIVFTSTRYVRYVDCVDVEPVTTLFVMDGDGRKLRGISSNHVHDWHPAVLGDGRIVYTRWEYTDRSQMWPHKLFVKNPDGSATAAYYGSNSWWPVSMLHARAVPGSARMLCTLAGHHSGTDQTGEIGLIDRARGTEEAEGVVALFPPRPIAPIYRDDPRPGPDSYYTEPYPLSDRWFLVSARLPGSERFGLYVASFGGFMTLLYEDDAQDCLSAMPMVARVKPPMIASQVDYALDEATIVMADVYRGAGLTGIPRGTVQALRVLDFDVRDTPGTGGLRQEDGPSGGHSCPVTALGGSWHVKRILGTVPVHEDGSAAFRIPAERRIFFQPLDERGMAIQTMRSWVEAMPGEHISCVGCHEPMHESPRPTTLLALRQEPAEIRPWYGPPRAFSFPREVQPVLDRHCIGCHNADDPQGLDLRGDATNWFSLAYENLRPFVNPIGPQGLPAVPAPRSQGAVASRLVTLLSEGHAGVSLDAESLDRIVTWIDLNIPYYDNTAVTRPSRVALSNEVTGSGRAVVADATPLWAVLGDRCTVCHPSGFRINPTEAPCHVPDLPETIVSPVVNLTHPAQSRILTAPLARADGGLQRCSATVFADCEDPAYRAALKVIEQWHQELLARPREDMPGFVPCEAYDQTQLARETWLRFERAARDELKRP